MKTNFLQIHPKRTRKITRIDFVNALSLSGFKQVISQPTHIEGRTIDHVYTFFPPGDTSKVKTSAHCFGQYFTDHDLLYVSQVKEFAP